MGHVIWDGKFGTNDMAQVMGNLILNADFGHIRRTHYIEKMIQDVTGWM